jgi:hypothetical protein
MPSQRSPANLAAMGTEQGTLPPQPTPERLIVLLSYYKPSLGRNDASSFFVLFQDKAQGAFEFSLLGAEEKT